MKRQKSLLPLLLAANLALGVFYAFTTPIFEASDELWHYPMVRHLAAGNPLPIQNPDDVGAWKQEASQPPLYYYLGAALTFWIDQNDMEKVRWLNPHVDNGVITSDGNSNLAIHDPSFSRWEGALLAVTVVRLASALMGAATVYLTYRIGQAAAPSRPEIGLGAAGIHAFMPMYLFISGAVNNDNLAMLLTSLGLWFMVRLIVRQEPLTARTLAPMGFVLGLGALTKQGALALFPLAVGALFVAHWRQNGRDSRLPALGRSLGQTLISYLWILLPALVIAGWWYWRNIQLYGDLLGWSAFFQVLGVRAHPASLAQLWDERWGFMLSYWGLFGGVNVPMASWIYHLLNGILILGVIGFSVELIRRIRRHRLPQMPASSPPSNWFGNLLSWVEAEFPLVICLLLSFAVIYGLIQWATFTWSSQGRLVFTAISALNVLLAVGLGSWLPAKFARAILGSLVAFLFVVATLAPILWIRPAYAFPNRSAAIAGNPIQIDFGDKMRLVSFEFSPNSLLPGDELDLWLTWETLQTTEKNWSVFAQLIDPVTGVPIAQRDMYPGGGLAATSLLRPGDRLRDHYRLQLPPTAIAPAQLTLQIGLYDFYTEERLPASTGEDAVPIGAIPLTAASGGVPNPLSVNFEDRVELVGFAVKPRQLNVGETLDLTLHWQIDRPLDADYTFFAQLLGAENHRWAAADISPPIPTSTWETSTVQSVEMRLQLDPATPPGVYPIIIGAYTQPEPGIFERLQIVTPDGRLTQDDFLQLTLVRVDG